jgi:hypothetical protein
MKTKEIKKLKLIYKNFKKNKDVKELDEAINKLPPEIQELYNTILETRKKTAN